MKKRNKIILGIVFVFTLIMITAITFVNKENKSTSEFARSIKISNYKVLSNNSASNKIIVDGNKSDIEKLPGVTNIQKTNGLYFVTFDSVKHSDDAYNKLKNKKITVNKDLYVKVQSSNNSEQKAITNNEKGIKVAVIDSGVNGATESYDTTGEGIKDLNGHGTMIGNIIEETSGNNAHIVSIKAFDSNGNGSIASLYAAIKLAIEKDVDIINLSATTGYKVESQPVVDAIKEATSKGIRVVCASGNYSANTKDFATANIQEADVVSAVDNKGNFAGYSNFGNTIDYSALGTYNGEKGTSIATARITGYIIKYGKDFENNGIDLGEAGKDIYFGKGTYGVNVRTGELPNDSFRSIIFHSADWEELSDKEFKKAIENSKETYLSVWLKSLNQKELKTVLIKDSMLNWDHYELDNNGNRTHTQKYYEYLLSINIPDVKTMDALNATNGYYNLGIYDYKNTNTSQSKLFYARIGAKISSTADKQQTITWSCTSETNSCSFKLKSGTYKTQLSSGNFWTIFTNGFTYKKPANRYATEEKIWPNNNENVGEFNTKNTNSNGNAGNVTLDSQGVSNVISTENISMRLNARVLGMNEQYDGSENHGTYKIILKQPKLNITYNANGGTNAPKTQTGYYNNNITLSNIIPIKTGRRFLGWAISNNATTAKYKSGYKTTAIALKSYTNNTKFNTQNLTLYAVWDYYWTTLKFYSDNNTELGTGYITYDNSIMSDKYSLTNSQKNPSNYNNYVPIKEGALFEGWNTKYDGSGDIVITKSMLDDNKLNISNITNSYWKNGYWVYSGTEDNTLNLYPKWKDKKAKITYNANANDISGETKQTYTVSSIDETFIKVSMFTREGYILKSWNTKADGTGTEYKEGQPLGHYPNINNSDNEDITLYAQWIKADYYKGLQFKNIKKEIPPENPIYSTISEEYGFNQSITIHKKDSENIVVPNVTFDVECEDGSVTTVTTDEKGNAIANFSFDISTDDLNKQYYYCTNYNELSDEKKVDVLNSGMYLTETEARQAALNDLKNYVKTIEKKYIIKEISYPDYVLKAEDKEITLKGENATDEVSIIDALNIEPQTLSGQCTLTPVFKIRKINKQNEPLAGVKINIYADADKTNLLVQGVTNNKGEIKYEGKPVTYKTNEYKYIDVADYGEASERLKEYCNKHGYYPSYQEAFDAYKKDVNYPIVIGADENGSIASREKEMERTYYYQEIETLDGYKLDNKLHSATVFWFKSDDINNNLITNASKDNEFNADANDDEIENNGNTTNVNSDGDEVDYATTFVNYQYYNLKEIKDNESFEQKLTLIKKGNLGNLLPGATFLITVDEKTQQYTTGNEGKINITNTFDTKTTNTYKYIENLNYVSDEDIENILAKSTQTEQIYKTIEKAKEAAKKEVSDKREKSYHIHEVTAPAGYELCEDIDITLKYNEIKEITLIDENLGSIKIIKNDSDKKPMKDAVFLVYTNDITKKNNNTYNYKNNEYYLLSEQKTSDDGITKIENLKSASDVKYLIVEKITKGGKTLLSDPIEVGSLPRESEEKPNDNYKGTVVKKDNKYYYYDITYTVTNDNVYKLPKTGTNIPYYYLVGLLIILAGSITLVKTKQKKVLDNSSEN